jgi:hypothetical protein
MKMRLGAWLLLTATGFSLLASVAQADSFTVTGPGMRVQERRGWFGRHSASYDDALGNGIEQRQGLFHRYNRAGILGNQAQVSQSPFGEKVSVHGADGHTMIDSQRHWYGANNTTIDGNNIIHSVRNLFQTPGGTSAPQNTPGNGATPGSN